MNKTFQQSVKTSARLRNLGRRGALGKFISGCKTTTPETFELGKLILRAGAKVHVGIANHALECLSNQELAYLIISSAPGSDHADFPDDRVLSFIAVKLSDWQATEVINKFILACQQTNCGRCLSRFQRSCRFCFGARCKIWPFTTC